MIFMFRFANIEILWLLVTIPVFIAAYVIYTKRKRRQLAEFGDAELMEQLMPNASRVRPAVKFSIVMVALPLLIIAAARPQFGQSERTEKRQGIEAIVALDISNSMMALALGRRCPAQCAGRSHLDQGRLRELRA